MSSRDPLPTRPDTDHPGNVWSKTGLWIHAGTTVDLAVIGPPGSTFMWNNQPPGPATDLQVPQCNSDHPWINFAGGYVVRRAACVVIEVRTPGRSTRARVPVGVPCS